MAMTASKVQPIGSRSPVLQVGHTFGWQSWFDSTKLEKAIAIQPAGTQIPEAQEESQSGGFSLILHRSSQTPIAVTAKGEGSAPTIYTLAPGQSLSPLGDRPFRSFTWGLPFGWLGGGMAQLLVTQQPHEPTFGEGGLEIPFHRARFAIKQPSDLTAGGYNNSPLNWPIRFPWVQNTNQSSVAQPGSPILAPEPTRIVMVLRGLTTLAIPTAMRVIIEGADDFNLDAGGNEGQLDQAGATAGGFPIYDDIPWPAWNSIGTSGNLATQNPGITIDGDSQFGQELLRLGCSGVPYTPTAVGITLVDESPGALAGTGGALAGCFVDIVRYGRL